MLLMVVYVQMMVMDSTIESTADVMPITSSQDGVVVKKKKKKRRPSTPMKELPPLRLPPNISLELHQLSGVYMCITVCSVCVVCVVCACVVCACVVCVVYRV